ncbi:MAG TPA: hypothetical protein HA221_04095 [Halobacteria archaeon]|nr:hypothetical protein [Halobacteria archaeon]
MVKEKDKSFNNYIDEDEADTKKVKDDEMDEGDEEGFTFDDEDIPEEDRVADLIDLEEILDKDIIVRGIKTMPSSFHEGNYAIIQIEKDGKLYIVNTSSSVLMDQIENKKNEIPFKSRITKHENPATGHRYYTLLEENLGLGDMFEGEKIELDQILDKDIIVRGIKTRPSSYYEGDYAIIQIEKDGKLYVVNTSSSVLMDQIKKRAEEIPFRCRVVKQRSAASKRYYYNIMPVR